MPANTSADQQWWELTEKISLNAFWEHISNNIVVNSSDLFIITFNDRVAPEALSFLTGYG